MVVERMQVEEGFLDGLDLVFTPGLNVLIGPRGSGKTSVLELLRFCFGVEAFTQRAGRAALEHALSVLGPSGRVSVTVSIDGERTIVSRAAGDERPRYQVEAAPIVLSQGEIESVGLDAAGRLRIVDGFRSPSSGASEDSLLSSIRSLTVQLQDVGREVARYEAQAEGLSGAEAELQAAESAEAALTKDLAALRSDQERLGVVGGDLAAISVRLAVFERVMDGLGRWRDAVAHLARARPSIEQWPEAAQGADPLGVVREHAEAAAGSLRTSLEEINVAIASVERLRDVEKAREVELSDEARTLRSKLEAAQEGAGGASRRVAQLREQVGQLSALRELITEKRAEASRIQQLRTGVLDQLDQARESRFAARLKVVQRLNEELGPRIEVKLTQEAATAEYASAIASTLRGSGLHYTNLAQQLAERLSPRELVEAVESGDKGLIASLGGITADRASRLIEHIRETGCEEILAAVPEDAVEFFLLDGRDYKPTEDLSTGQRCTVVLPILLTHRDRVLLVDEPEAHLDNAFVVATVIQALQRRRDSPESQFIFATHNANIPVLGEADEVVLLGSDGYRGFVRERGPLHAPEIVDAVTAVMEGGREAFERRAEFYHSHEA